MLIYTVHAHRWAGFGDWHTHTHNRIAPRRAHCDDCARNESTRRMFGGFFSPLLGLSWRPAALALTGLGACLHVNQAERVENGVLRWFPRFSYIYGICFHRSFPSEPITPLPFISPFPASTWTSSGACLLSLECRRSMHVALPLGIT